MHVHKQSLHMQGRALTGGDHGDSAKAVLVTAKGGGHQHVATGAHAAVHPQHHLLPQVVGCQRLQ